MRISFIKLTHPESKSIFYMRSDRILSMQRRPAPTPTSITIGMAMYSPKCEATYLKIDQAQYPIYCAETPEEVQELLRGGDQVDAKLDEILSILKKE